MLTIMVAIYEDPAIVALGPTWSAVAAGFAVVWFGEVYLTSAGEMYLQSIGGNQRQSIRRLGSVSLVFSSISACHQTSRRAACDPSQAEP